jgi:crossover junction endodeoxyribonuclease RusA
MAQRSASPERPLRLILPLPPSVNNQYVTVGRRRVLSAPARAFNGDVLKSVEALRASGHLAWEFERTLVDISLSMSLTYYFETPRKRDLDGGLKITLDALARALGFDDRDIVDLHLAKKIDPLHPRVEVELEAIADWEFDRSYQYLGG